MDLKKRSIEELRELLIKLRKDVEDLRECLALIPEDTFLSRMSLKANIKMKMSKIHSVEVELAQRILKRNHMD